MKLASQLTRSGSISSSEAAMSSLSDEVQGQVSAITRTIVHTTSRVDASHTHILSEWIT